MKSGDWSIDVYDDARERAELIELWRMCGLIFPQNNPQRDIDRKLSQGLGEILVVRESSHGRLVGTVMWGYEGHRGSVNYLGVHPDYRGLGIGRALMTIVEEQLLSAGCPKINLMVRTSNQDVVAFYESLGYEINTLFVLGKRLIDDQRDENF